MSLLLFCLLCLAVSVCFGQYFALQDAQNAQAIAHKEIAALRRACDAFLDEQEAARTVVQLLRQELLETQIDNAYIDNACLERQPSARRNSAGPAPFVLPPGSLPPANAYGLLFPN